MKRGTLAGLMVAGVASEIIYLWYFAGRLALADYAHVPHMDLGKITEYGRLEALQYLGAMGALFVLYVVGYKCAERLKEDSAALAVCIGFAAVFGVTLLWVYPFGALDVFGYVFQGKALAIYQVNPFFVPASAFQQDPLFPYLAWVDEPSMYGPLWVLISGGAALVYGSSMLGGLLAFKVIALVFYLFATGLVFLVVRHLAPERAVAAAILMAWNPLLVTETVANGHNDIAMACLVLGALYLLARDDMRASLPVLMASVMAKFVTLVLLPAFLLSWLRARWPSRGGTTSVVVGLVLAGAVAVVCYWPFWEGLATVGALRRGDLFTASMASVAFQWLLEAGHADVGRVVRLTCYGVFLAYAIWRTLRVRAGAASLAEACFDLVFAYLMIATLWFQPWYLVLLVPFVATSQNPARRALGVVYTATAVLNYFVFVYVWIWNWDALSILQVQSLAVVAIHGLPLLIALGLIVRWAWRGLGAVQARRAL